MTGMAGLTPHSAATAGSILISAQSLPGSPSPEVMCDTVPTTAIVVVSTCIVTSWPRLSTQWRAVPTYCEAPSVKMKFAVQPYGATMQPPAETPGLCTPGHSVLSAASGSDTPFAPFLASFFSMFCFMNLAGARVGPLAVATPAVVMTSANASTTPGLKRMDPPSESAEGAPSRGTPDCS